MLLITTVLQKHLLLHLFFLPEVLMEDDGSVNLAFDALELYVNQPTLEAAYQDLADDLIGYAQDYMEREGIAHKAVPFLYVFAFLSPRQNYIHYFEKNNYFDLIETLEWLYS